MKKCLMLSLLFALPLTALAQVTTINPTTGAVMPTAGGITSGYVSPVRAQNPMTAVNDALRMVSNTGATPAIPQSAVTSAPGALGGAQITKNAAVPGANSTTGMVPMVQQQAQGPKLTGTMSYEEWISGRNKSNRNKERDALVSDGLAPNTELYTLSTDTNLF